MFKMKTTTISLFHVKREMYRQYMTQSTVNDTIASKCHNFNSKCHNFNSKCNNFKSKCHKSTVNDTASTVNVAAVNDTTKCEIDSKCHERYTYGFSYTSVNLAISIMKMEYHWQQH